MARGLGAEAAVDPSGPDPARLVRELVGGDGPDKGLDGRGAAAARRRLVNTGRQRAAVGFIGQGGELALRISRSRDLVTKGLI